MSRPGDHPRPDDQTALVAVYDLAVSRISFDFFNFLVLAEVERRKRSLGHIHLVVVPAEGDGFHPNIQYDLEQKRWRLRNLVHQGLSILPSVKGVTISASRTEAAGLVHDVEGVVFPQNYSVEEPIARWVMGWMVLAAACGENLQVLRASNQAAMYARQWLEARTNGRRPIVMTLREATHNPQRNTSLEKWSDGASILSEQGYMPVVLRDIETALLSRPAGFEGAEFMPEAVFNLDLRLALYEQAHLNICVTNGPPSLGFFSRSVRFAYFLTGDWLNQVPSPFGGFGIEFGEQFPWSNRFQRSYWCRHDGPSLASAADDLNEVIERCDPSDWESAQDPVAENRCALPTLAERFLDAGEFDLFEAAFSAAVTASPDDPELQYLRGLKYRSNAFGDHDVRAEKAGEAFDQALSGLRELGERAALSPRQEYVRAKCQSLTGNAELAVTSLQEAIRHWPGNRQLDECAGDFALEAGEFVRAAEHYEAASSVEPVRPELSLKHATALSRAGEIPRAVRYLSDLIERYPEFAQGYQELGLIHEGLGQLENAFGIYNMAASRGCATPETIYRLGQVLERLDQPKEAERCYRKLLDRGVSSKLIVESLSALYRRCGDWSAALETYNQAIDEDSADEELQKRRDELQAEVAGLQP